MTSRTKSILLTSIPIFKAIPKDRQERMLQSVKDNLRKHYNGLEKIGMGLDTDMVAAGEIFLRIFNT